MTPTRTPPQQVADLLKDRHIEDARGVIQRFGLDDTGGVLLTLARFATIDAAWIAVLDRAWDTARPAARAPALHALLTLLARHGAWSGMRTLADWLLDRIDPTELARAHPLHHAAFHGRAEAFEPLLQRLTQGRPSAFDWTAATADHDTPLTLAIESGNIATMAVVRAAGGADTERVASPVASGHAGHAPRTLTAIEYVLRYRRPENADATIHAWEAARDKAVLLGAADQTSWEALMRAVGGAGEDHDPDESHKGKGHGHRRM